jgi:carboxypeptidase C (cathepsin A)
MGTNRESNAPAGGGRALRPVWRTSLLQAASCLLAAALGFVSPAAAGTEDGKPDGKGDGAAKRPDLPVPKEESTVTHHQVRIGDQDIPYTATAGNLVISKGNDPIASFFYVAYVRDGFKDAARRPVTFFYNGGPGSATVWLHMGSFGPRIVETLNAKASGPAPYQVVNNGDSLLDRSDLVFIDAVGTGLSRLAGKGKGADVWSVDGDVEAFGKFITRYLTINRRWNSPKFLFGESYGTLRSAALVDHLQQQGMQFNGVVLLSSVLNYEALTSPALDEPYVNILPTYAAIAWVHDRLPHKSGDLAAFLQEARDFAIGDYAQALAKGQTLPEAQLEAVAARLHEFTGLSVAYLKEANLRVKPARFRKELLRGERLTVGRYDGRFEGIDFDAAGEKPDSDPSETAVKGAFTAALNSYLSDELNYSHDTPYLIRSTDFSYRDWDYMHKLPEYLGEQVPYRGFVGEDLAQAMRENPRLKVLSANGYFDLATPFFGTERDLYHMELEPSLRGNLTIRYYQSGHMVYLNPEAHKAFRADLAAFYDSAAPP